MCHIFLCIYQILNNKTVRESKRKRKHKGEPKLFSIGLLVCSGGLLACSPHLHRWVSGVASEGPSWLASPGLPIQHSGGPEPAPSSHQAGDLQHHLQLRFLPLLSFMVSELSLCSTPILCLDFNLSHLPSDKCLL